MLCLLACCPLSIEFKGEKYQVKCSYCGRKIKWYKRKCSHCHIEHSHWQKIRNMLGKMMIPIILYGGTILYIEYENKVFRDEQRKVINKAIALIDIDGLDEAEKFITEVREAVFGIHTEMNRSGSAFLINNEGILITNAHVVEGAESVTVRSIRDENKTGYDGKVLKVSQNYDIALIEVEGLEGIEPYDFQWEDQLNVHEQVIVTSGLWVTTKEIVDVGKFLEKKLDFSLNDLAYDTIYYSNTFIVDGYSGGPLVSVPQKKIVGINTASHRMGVMTYSIPLFVIKEELESWLGTPLR